MLEVAKPVAPAPQPSKPRGGGQYRSISSPRPSPSAEGEINRGNGAAALQHLPPSSIPEVAAAGCSDAEESADKGNGSGKSRDAPQQSRTTVSPSGPRAKPEEAVGNDDVYMPCTPLRTQPGQKFPGLCVVYPKGVSPKAQKRCATSDPVVPVRLRQKRTDPEDLQEPARDNKKLLEEGQKPLLDAVGTKELPDALHAAGEVGGVRFGM